MKKCFSLIFAFAFVMGVAGIDLATAGECIAGSVPEMNNGRCSFSGNCFPDPGGNNNDCDSTAPNQGGGSQLPPPTEP